MVLLGSQQRNSRCLFLLRGFLRSVLPVAGRAKALAARYERASPEERAAIRRAGDHYMKRETPFDLDAGAASVEELSRRMWTSGKTSYYLDLHEHLRLFAQGLRVHYRFGDKVHVPDVPTLVKARPLSEPNENAVVMKLNKVRHFHFVKDDLRFERKIGKLVWRGNAGRPHRQRVVAELHRHPLCDVGYVGSGAACPGRKPYLSIREQLRYRYVLAIEGNDVATSLKWSMSSNSLCFMTRPTKESWFMEGSLVPDHHYVLLKDDYSDLEEKILFYESRPDLARRIVSNAQAYVARFRDHDLEALTALFVLDKYFALSGQSPRLGWFATGSRRALQRC